MLIKFKKKKIRDASGECRCYSSTEILNIFDMDFIYCITDTLKIYVRVADDFIHYTHVIHKYVRCI